VASHPVMACAAGKMLHKTGLRMLQIGGADPRFQVRGGALKKNAPSGGRGENVWGISCEKSRFYAKKSFFFQY
jgi:hypothetical protein